MDIDGELREIQFVREAARPDPDPLAKEEKRQLFIKAKRHDEIKHALHAVSLVAIWVIFLVMLMVCITRVVHFILPDQCHWLKAEGLQSIDKFLFSGVLGGLVSKHIGKIFGILAGEINHSIYTLPVPRTIPHTAAYTDDE